MNYSTCKIGAEPIHALAKHPSIFERSQLRRLWPKMCTTFRSTPETMLTSMDRGECLHTLQPLRRCQLDIPVIRNKSQSVFHNKPLCELNQRPIVQNIPFKVTWSHQNRERQSLKNTLLRTNDNFRLTTFPFSAFTATWTSATVHKTNNDRIIDSAQTPSL